MGDKAYYVYFSYWGLPDEIWRRALDRHPSLQKMNRVFNSMEDAEHFANDPAAHSQYNDFKLISITEKVFNYTPRIAKSFRQTERQLIKRH